MQLHEFITQVTKDASFCTSKSIISFTGQEYPLLGMHCAFEKIRDHISLPCKSIDVTQLDFNLIKAQLETSFLGQRMMYCLYGLHLLDSKKQNTIISYLNNYQGEHTIVCFNSENLSHQEMLSISMPDAIDRRMFIALAHAMNLSAITANHSFINYLFTYVKTLTLDQTILLFSYGSILGSNTQAFCTQWLDRIILGEHSLFLLSQLFFAKQAEDFFSLWKSMEELYSVPFWVTFWSEQLFRAAATIEYYQKKEIAQAKKIGYRLPFSFLQRDWKKSTVSELKKAHNFIYDIDYTFKNGSRAPALDLFYSKFFLGEFKL